MRAIQFSRFGGPEVLEIVEVPTPVAGPGEVLVRMQAAGVNFFETLMRANCYVVTPELPMVPGVEIAGIVEAVGEDVSPSILGLRVAVPMFAIGRPAGGYADFIAVDANSIVPLPDELSYESATALMVQGLTALYLSRHVYKGQSVLITAAAGGVGSLLVQLTKRGGAGKVIAAAGSEEKLNVVQSFGVDASVNYGAPDWATVVREATEGEGVDIIYDFIGGAMTRSCIDSLAPGGAIVFSALGRMELQPADLERIFAANQAVEGFSLLPLLTPEKLKTDLLYLFKLAIAGKIKVILGGAFPLDKVDEAHRLLDERRSTGKIVLIP